MIYWFQFCFQFQLAPLQLGEVARAASRVGSKGGAENMFGRLKFDEEAAAAASGFQAGRCAANHANAPQFIHHVLEPMLFCGRG
jgi:hypothetical protein